MGKHMKYKDDNGQAQQKNQIQFLKLDSERINLP